MNLNKVKNSASAQEQLAETLMTLFENVFGQQALQHRLSFQGATG
jgi:hypothetical protein